jgi:AcrR family transcriptional regulator
MYIHTLQYMKKVGESSRIERRKTEFRDKITSTALRLFEQNGVAETSIASIIKEADIAHKTFFNHFPSKDHLLQHIVSSHSEHAYDFFRDAIKRYDDPRKRMEYCLLSIAKALEPINAQHYRDLLTFYFISSASTREFRDEQKRNFSKLVNQILLDAQKQKRLRPGSDIETLSEMIVGISVATLLSWSVEENYPIVAKMKKAVGFINESIFTERALT